GTVCIDTQTQQEIWRTQFPSVESVGPGSSPLLVDGKLILPFDGTDDQFVVALDADTGEPVWRTERPTMEGNEKEYHKAFSTPVLIEHEGRRQVVIVGAQWVCSYDPETGEELWRLRHGKGFSMSPRPVYGNGLIYICTAYAGIGVAAIDPSGNGDVTGSHLRWSHESQAPNMSSPILVGEQIYFVSDRGIATCLNALDGERLWRERLGGNFCASPILVGEHLYFANREGKVHVIKARPDYEPVVVNDLGEAVMASPAVIGDDLLIRTDDHLYRIGS
ncbi:MAG: PQQ-binding-like beta-propeller repeat protein, partial [Planctomycetota bacterium]